MWRCCSLHALLPLCCSDAATHPDCHLASFGSVTLDTPMNRKFMPKADFSTWTPLEYIAEWVPKQSFSLLCFYLDWGCVYMFLSIFKWWNVQDVQFYRSPIMQNSNCTLLGHSHFKLIYFLNALISFNCCTAPACFCSQRPPCWLSIVHTVIKTVWAKKQNFFLIVQHWTKKLFDSQGLTP